MGVHEPEVCRLSASRPESEVNADRFPSQASLALQTLGVWNCGGRSVGGRSVGVWNHGRSAGVWICGRLRSVGVWICGRWVSGIGTSGIGTMLTDFQANRVWRSKRWVSGNRVWKSRSVGGVGRWVSGIGTCPSRPALCRHFARRISHQSLPKPAAGSVPTFPRLGTMVSHYFGGNCVKMVDLGELGAGSSCGLAQHDLP